MFYPIQRVFSPTLYRLAFLAARAAVIGGADDPGEAALPGDDGGGPPVQGVGGGGLGPAALCGPWRPPGGAHERR